MEQAKNDTKNETKVTSNAGPTGLAAAATVATTPEVKSEETKTEETKTEETKTEETKSETTFKADDGEVVDAYAVYDSKSRLVKIFKLGTHGDNPEALAKAFAERKSTNTDTFVSKPYIPEVNIEEVDVDTVHIVTLNNQPVRTFSLKVHGKEYKKLATQFIEKYGVKKGYKVKA